MAHNVKIKNTFIDVEDDDAPPPPADLRRAKSETAARQPVPEDPDDGAASEVGQSPSNSACHSGAAAVSSSSTALAPPPGGGCEPQVVVRKTFIDVMDAPQPGFLERSKTEPTTPYRPEDDEGPDFRQPWAPEGAVVQEGSEMGAGFISDDEEFDPSEVPPPPKPEYVRLITEDRMETSEYWTWRHDQLVGGAPAGPSMQQPVPPQQMAGQPMPGQQMPGQPMPGFYAAGGIVMQVPYMQVALSGGPPMQPAPELSRIKTPGEPPAGTPSAGSASASAGADAGGAAEEGVTVPAHIVLPDAQAPVMQVLQRMTSTTSPLLQRIQWKIDAKKLKATDREHVSPAFEVEFLTKKVLFKLVLRPKVVHEARGGASFKKAKGLGCLELRCLERLDAGVHPMVTFRLTVLPSPYEETPRETIEFRGPVVHDFSSRSTTYLPKDQDEWNFTNYVNPALQCFFVVVEIQIGTGAAAP